MDAVFAAQILQEKCKELHLVFVDLEKAYNRVPRKLLWWFPQSCKLPEAYVETIMDMYEDSTTAVRSNCGYSELFGVRIGLYQGPALSPSLFVIVMDTLTLEMLEANDMWCHEDTYRLEGT